MEQPLTFGERAADKVTEAFGSWKFIIWMSAFIVVWVIYNTVSPYPFDHYPFIFLTLLLSLQASYAAPLILLSQTRQSQMDKEKMQRDLDADLENLSITKQIAEHLGVNDVS